MKRVYSNIIKNLQPISVSKSTISLKIKSYINNFITYCINNNMALTFDTVIMEEKLLYIQRELELIPKTKQPPSGETCELSDEKIGKNIELMRNEPEEKESELIQSNNITCNPGSENQKLIGKVGNDCLYYDIVTNKVTTIKVN